MRTDKQYFTVFVFLVGVAVGMALLLPQQVLTGPTSSPDNVRNVTKTIIVSGNHSTPLPGIYEAAKDSVVSIRAEGEGGSISQGAQGSGFVYDTAGHIVTNNHVVDKGTRYVVHFVSGVQVEAQLVGTDPYSDLAVLRVDPSAADLQPLQVTSYESVQVGEDVVAIGNPFGLDSTMTAGIVSQKDRLLQTAGEFSIPNVIQTDAAINPGNSGGPLLDMEGNVIGVNTAISSRSNTFAGVGFAVSVETVNRIVPELIETGNYQHAWIGVSGVDISPEIAEEMGMNRTYGFLIIEVVDGSPADEAGVQAGEREVEIGGSPLNVGGDVIVGINGERMRKIDDILNYLAKETAVGETVTLNLIRDGEQVNVPLTLDRRPQPGG